MRVYNFSAGPATLPEPVLAEAQDQLLEHGDSGQSVMEMSHRSPHYDAVHRDALERLARLFTLPEGYSVLLLQGGASLQFTMLAQNLMHPHRKADYVLTGAWSQKALEEARREGEARVAASTEEGGFRRVPRPDELQLDPQADYVHITTNNTIYGTQWPGIPHTGAVPLVADASSDVLCRPVDVSRFGLLYAGAQKNLGPAGVTVVVVRDELLARAPESLPSMLRYRVHAAKDSLYNTPPTWSIYVLGLACRWLEAQGGTTGMAEINRRKAMKLYAVIDGGDFYRGHAEPASRSWMNVTFRLPSAELEARFVARAAEEGMVNLKGHRSVGGCRASIYNAMPEAGVDALVSFMREFERTEG